MSARGMIACANPPRPVARPSSSFQAGVSAPCRDIAATHAGPVFQLRPQPSPDGPGDRRAT